MRIHVVGTINVDPIPKVGERLSVEGTIIISALRADTVDVSTTHMADYLLGELELEGIGRFVVQREP